MRRYRARWLLPISQPPIENGWVDIDRGRIVAVGTHRPGDPPPDLDLGDAALLPGLVNAHTHLELSWMRGRVTDPLDFPGWIGEVIRLQRSGPPSADVADQSTREAINEARSTGTVLFGDISNTLASVPALIDSALAAVIFHELIGFPAARAAQTLTNATTRLQALPASGAVRYTLAAHAPYSVSPALFTGIHRALADEARCSVHLGESAAEIEFLETGRGPWRTLLEEVGSWDAVWEPPASSPVEYLDRLGFLDDRLLVVHGVHLKPADLERLRQQRTTLVACPRGNLLTRAGSPPIAAFYNSGVSVAVGTDSLASVPDLNLFSELAALRSLAPAVPARDLLASATLNGARALGFGSDYGTIAAGKRGDLIAVSLPRDVSDVEEHLVRGIAAGDVLLTRELEN